MKRKSRPTEEKPVLDLIEEAVELARRAPPGAWLAYYTGALPFVLGLLYFWADMSSGAFARYHMVEASLGMALLFIWMKCWQAVAAARMGALVSDEPPPKWTARRIFRMAVVQAILDPPALFVRPVAVLITVPYGWVHASYQNVVVLGDGSTADAAVVFRDASRQARLWPRQNHAALAVLVAFGLVVWANVASLMVLTPLMLKTLLGVETIFSKSAWSLVNTTMFTAICGVTYLCVDPLFKCFYVLRCFYGRSMKSGEDLRVELKRWREPMVAVAALILLIAPCGRSARAADMERAEPSPAPAVTVSPGGADPAVLDRRIAEVIEHPRFAWRMPREAAHGDERGLIAGFIEGAYEAVMKWLRPIKNWLRDRLADWLRRQAEREQPGGESNAQWLQTVKTLIYVLCGLAAIAAAWLLWRRSRQGRRRVDVVAETIAAAPDLSSEELVADQLPGDEWMRLAREMTEKGEFRLASRALYLAGLAHLGSRELVTLARYKSNLEYERELRRRARSRAEVLEAFSQNVAAFERVWYGRHAATREGLERFSVNLNQIRAC